MALPDWLKKLATYGSVLRSFDSNGQERLTSDGSMMGWVGVDNLHSPIYASEQTEIVAPATAASAVVTGPMWLSTQNLLGGVVYAQADTVTGATGWTLTAHYSMDGVTEVASEVIATGTGGVATGAETLIVGLTEAVDAADSKGFADKIKQFPFVKFSVEFAGTVSSGTVESYAHIKRFYQ